MYIEKIQLNHFRNYDRLTFLPHEGINILYGQNGSGKTNLLESIHYCALGKSHRMNQDLNAVEMGKKSASCLLSVRGKYGRNEIEIRLQPGEDEIKTVWIDQKRVSRLSEMMGVLRCVIFSPEDLNLMKDGPAVRRRFLDMMISQISRPYFIALQQYRIALNQRNAILRVSKLEKTKPNPMIQDFETAMSEYAKAIYNEREKYTEMLSAAGNQIYRKISGKENERFSIEYHAFVKWNKEENFPLKEMLKESREEDIRQGMTTIGPQRDDLILSMNQKNMKLYASQGQIRTGALSMKLAQMNIFREITGEQPVLLPDDVLSELDLERRMNLLKMIGDVQTFMTCSEEGDLAENQNHRTCQVISENGKASLVIRKEGPESAKIKMEEPVFD